MVSAILTHGGSFMMPRFDETCDAVMALKDKHGRSVYMYGLRNFNFR